MIVAIYIDGIILGSGQSKHHVLTALGVDQDGNKLVRGLREGASENGAVVKALLEDQVARGVKPLDTHGQAIKRLFVIDGSKVVRAAFKMEDHTKAMGKIKDLARELDDEWPGAAGSLLEGLDELFTVNHLGLPPSLRRSLATTNIIESPQSKVRRLTHKVDRWRDGRMALRWAGASFAEAEKTMRRIGGHGQL